MPRKSWSEAVQDAVRRHVSRTGSMRFTRDALIAAELPAIIVSTGSVGGTPHQTLSRELQQLRDKGLIEFEEPGIYRWIEGREPLPPSKGVFVVAAHSLYRDQPDRFYRFGPQWLSNAMRVVGNWILYQEPRRAGKRGYYAVAKVDRIVPDPSDSAMHLALIEPGSFLEFGQDVAFQQDGKAIEHGLLNADGRLNNGRAVQSIRLISDADFNRISDKGLIENDALLPRNDDEEVDTGRVREERAIWDAPVDRAIALSSRKVRDRQFRKRVLDAYDATCALTGMKLINGGGRAEVQAAHVMSVEAGGPDAVTNGIALSGTIHWMFDRGLISLADDGTILLSRKINDVDSVKRIISADRKARLPRALAQRPHQRYLSWHRDECFHG